MAEQNAGPPAGQPNGQDFSLAFQQMANFLAIAKTKRMTEVLDELVKQCFVILPDEPLSSAASVAKALRDLFGICLVERDVGQSLVRLVKAGDLQELPGDQLGLTDESKHKLQGRIDSARQLEEEVRQAWLSQVRERFSSLDGDRLWSGLKAYLAQAFRKHGIQAVALLDPAVESPSNHVTSLSAILDAAICQNFDAPQREDARLAVSSFIGTVGADRRRAEYVSQLADCAFNYFSLSVAPEVSAQLRGKLQPLTLFLDTNFLFGVLNLHVNPQVEVSAELIDAVNRFKLPFRLRYHDATTREMTNTLYHFGGELRRRQWSQALSRAAVASGRFSGIELRYHQQNAQMKVEVEDFLAPYSHWTVMLKERGIDVYKVESTEKRLRARADLEADYKDYLAGVGKEKPVEAIQHDMAVLETVRSLRSAARSSLEAGALLVTCDYHLYRFNCEASRHAGRPASTVVPSLLWQILRPFVSDSIEFDQAFAATFALPEFNLSRGGAARAASRMLSILAGYKDIPEATASKMLANDLLIAELQEKHSDEAAQQAVESALARENAILIEEAAALAQQVARERQQREAHERELADRAEKLATVTQQVERTTQEAMSSGKALAEADEEKRRREEEVRRLGDELRTERTLKDATVAELAGAKQGQDRAEHRARNLERGLAVSLAIGITLVLEWYFNSGNPWKWLMGHPHSIGLQFGGSGVVMFAVVGIFVKSWRNWCFGTAVLGLACVVISLM